jgi:oligopeptidase A
LPAAQREYQELQAFAVAQGGHDLQPWDVAYYSEKLKQTRYSLSQEALRPWFPWSAVLEGLFSICERLFGVQFRAAQVAQLWHPDVSFFEVLAGDQVIAGFFLDPYARENKRGGAWMGSCRVRRRRLDGSLQRPVAYLVCNFNPPTGGQQALLTHQEVTAPSADAGGGRARFRHQWGTLGRCGITQSVPGKLVLAAR